MPEDRHTGPRSLPDRLQAGHSQLGRIVRQAQRLLTLQDQTRALLPANLRDHVFVAALDTGHLRLLVSSSARATQLRYLQGRLLEELPARSGESIHHISVAVRPPDRPSPVDQDPAPARLPASAAAQFQDMATEESDPGLKSALERLARRSR